MTTFALLLWVAGGALAVNVLGFLTEQASDCWHRVKRAPQVEPPAPLPEALVASMSRWNPPVEAHHTAGYWWTQVLSMAAMLGLLFVPLQAWVLLVNSDLLAQNFEPLLDRPGIPLIPVDMFGWQREITDFDLYGLLVSVAQMSAASALYYSRRERHHGGLVALLALIALPALVGFEVLSTVYRGLMVDHHLWNALLSGLQALGLGTLGALVGIFVIDCFLAPCVLALLWTLATPCRALARWLRQRRMPASTVFVGPPAAQPSRAFVAVLMPLVALDTALMAPLRAIDRATGRLLPQGNRPQHSTDQGERNDAQQTLDHTHAVSGNGHLPDGIQRHHPREFQSPDPVDYRA